MSTTFRVVTVDPTARPGARRSARTVGVLNASYEPLRPVTVQRAIRLLAVDEAVVESPDPSGRFVVTSNGQALWPWPTVVRLVRLATPAVGRQVWGETGGERPGRPSARDVLRQSRPLRRGGMRVAREVIVTGPPGSGKTTLLAALGAEVTVVPEAASDVVAGLLTEGVARPERHPEFLVRIVELQRARRLAAAGAVRLHDRSVFCTLALARFLELPVPAGLTAEIAAVRGVFADRVLYVEGLATIETTAVRRISHADAVAFGAVHRRVYLDHGFELVEVPPAAPDERADLVRAVLCELDA